MTGVYRSLTAINLLEEKEKFFSDPSSNPQFIYHDVVAEKKLYKHGLPKNTYVEKAKHIMVEAYHNRNEQDLKMMEGRLVSRQEVTRKIKHFLAMHQLDKRFEIVWSSSFIARTAITSDTIKLRLPSEFRRQGLLGMMYHEIGTHALRRVNYEQQAWYRKKNKFGFGSYLRTEEGLAIIHSLIPKDFRLAYTAALRYLAVELAQRASFAEVFQFLARYIQDQDQVWRLTYRVKRGLTDTSLPGGFTKDLVYFEGMVDVWHFLSKHDYDITQLYFGKMSYKDVDKALELNPKFKPMLPSFFVLDPTAYQEQVAQIGKINHL